MKHLIACCIASLIAVQVIAGDELKMTWIAPANQQVKTWEKIEWGFTLPETLRKAIENWIAFQKDHQPRSPMVNPFDPEQCDLTASISYQQKGNTVRQPVYGFYYRNFRRITRYSNPALISGMEDPDKWYWEEMPDGQSMRIRWAASVTGSHTVNIVLTAPGLGRWVVEPFTFEASTGNNATSFISMSDNGHYFVSADQKVFMPVGLNLTEGSFGCSCQAGVPQEADCEKCYEWGSDDPCCGMDVRKKQRSGMPGTSISEYSVGAAAYVKMERLLKAVSDAGGNAFRTFFDPMAYDIEFEKMNNYYDRQYQAWEFDQLLETCRKYGLRMELNLQYHYSICNHSFGFDRFDWGDEYNCMGCGKDSATTGTHGWCYNAECPDVDDPVDFLTNECALKNYKKKLRYIIARWGYSPNIYVMELMSEMNNIGDGSIWEVNIDTDGDGQKDDTRHHHIESLYYADAPRTRKAVAYWHNEMARYIKEDLRHTRHLIAADYTGAAPMKTDLNNDGDCVDEAIGEMCNPCQSDSYDNSWQSRYIDVIAFSNYTNGLNRWEKMSDHEYYKNKQSDGLLCGWNNPDDPSDDSKNHSPVGSYESIWKPVIHAENGLTACMDDDYTGFVKDMLTDVLGGHASSGMSWDEWSSTARWHYMGYIRQFFDKVVLTSMDPGKGKWRPMHAYSQRSGKYKDTSFAEAVAIGNSETRHYAGVVMNRTWNYYTQCSGACITEERRNEFRGANEALARFTPVKSDEDKVLLKNAGKGKHIIRYYDPVSMQLVKEVSVKSKRGKILLEKYPMMGDGSENHQPFYFFVVLPG